MDRAEMRYRTKQTGDAAWVPYVMAVGAIFVVFVIYKMYTSYTNAQKRE